MAEATNELAFMVTGMYGKPAPKQNGAPLRLATPWKYGFKSAKGIVKISFTDQQPMNFWQSLQSSEYGFWANVNPAVAHPRWSQADERVLGQDGTVPTQLFNGYGEFVADIYKDAVENRNLALFRGWNGDTCQRHQAEQPNCFQRNRFAAGIGAGNHQDGIILTDDNVQRYGSITQQRMSRLHKF